MGNVVGRDRGRKDVLGSGGEQRERVGDERGRVLRKGFVFRGRRSFRFLVGHGSITGVAFVIAKDRNCLE